MTIMELGSLGELISAIAVVVTLWYLAVQIRQNTHAMEENKRLALAQTYQIRADALQSMLVHAADSQQTCEPNKWQRTKRAPNPMRESTPKIRWTNISTATFTTG